MELLQGNRIELLESGREYFPALISAMDSAVREIHLETYLYEADASGLPVTEALCAAAGRGVKVRVLVDGFGGRDFPKNVMPRLIEAGVQVLIYRPDVGGFSFRRNRLRRLHRKMAVVDGQIGFVGGINIIDDNHTPRHKPPRYDFAVRLEGPLAGQLHGAVRHLWELVSWVNLQRQYRLLEPRGPEPAPCGSTAAALVIRDNIRHRRDIEDAYLEAIGNAQREILIANAYFLPGIRFRHALIAAAQRGVHVVLLLQGRVEYRLLHWATRALYGALLDGGVRLFEYHRSFMHAKVAVVDRHWATVGSSNIDPFSLMLAREANVVVKDASFAGQLQDRVQHAMYEGAHEIHPAHWKRKPLRERVLAWSAYGLVRALMGLAGYGGR